MGFDRRRTHREHGATTRVADLFERYRRTLQAPQRSVETAAAEVLSDLLGQPVSIESVRYTPATRTLALQLRGPLRTEAKLCQEELLTHLQGRLGVKNAPTTIIT